MVGAWGIRNIGGSGLISLNLFCGPKKFGEETVYFPGSAPRKNSDQFTMRVNIVGSAELFS